MMPEAYIPLLNKTEAPCRQAGMSDNPPPPGGQGSKCPDMGAKYNHTFYIYHLATGKKAYIHIK